MHVAKRVSQDHSTDTTVTSECGVQTASDTVRSDIRFKPLHEPHLVSRIKTKYLRSYWVCRTCKIAVPWSKIPHALNRFIKYHNVLLLQVCRGSQVAPLTRDAGCQYEESSPRPLPSSLLTPHVFKPSPIKQQKSSPPPTPDSVYLAAKALQQLQQVPTLVTCLLFLLPSPDLAPT